MKNKTQTSIPYIIAPETITVYLDGNPVSVHKSNINFDVIKNALQKEDFTKARNLISLKENIASFVAKSHKNIEIKDEEVYYEGEVIHNVLTEKLIELYQGGFSVNSLLLFLDNLMNNPSKRAINELYGFLENKNLPITPQGMFLGYKAVKNDWMDKYSGQFKHDIGAELSIKRGLVDDNWELACSSGFHVGSIEYVRGFACGHGTPNGDRIVIVEVNPADVVCCPSTEQKLRTCKYKVVNEFKGILDKPIYNSDATEYEEQEEEIRDGDYGKINIETNNSINQSLVIPNHDKKVQKVKNYLNNLNPNKEFSARVSRISKELNKKVNHSIIIQVAKINGFEVKEVGENKSNWIIRK